MKKRLILIALFSIAFFALVSIEVFVFGRDQKSAHEILLLVFVAAWIYEGDDK
jgi:hypothetical protein